jgi:hypothetical protein
MKPEQPVPTRPEDDFRLAPLTGCFVNHQIETAFVQAQTAGAARVVTVVAALIGVLYTAFIVADLMVEWPNPFLKYVFIASRVVTPLICGLIIWLVLTALRPVWSICCRSWSMARCR